MNDKLKKVTKVCNTLEDLPSLSTIESFERGTEYIFIFGDLIEKEREAIGMKWREEFPNFSIGIHINEPKIRFSKLITDKEIEDNQEFFVKAAKDYEELSTKLIHRLAEKFDLKIEEPIIKVFGRLKLSDNRAGVMDEWRYVFHGIDCRFTHTKTGQCIETPLTFASYFGKLDPYFFIHFIETTPKYQPIKLEIHHDYLDGKRILEKMVELDKFETIELENGNKGIVLKSVK